ncbi:NUDIX domain-containing protein [bacterium]|nr:MAG: NUDIX domain-containing protein [bacterium]
MAKPNVQIVNENDEVIGSKPRGEVDPQKDIYRVSGLWITNSKDEILLAQRKFTKVNDPGKWGPAVAGTLEEGETHESNIYKEAEEEIGLTGVKFKLGPKNRRREPRNYFGQWFLANVDRNIEDFKIQEEEVEKIAWVPKAELIEGFKNNPERYIPSMSKIIAELI